MGGRGSKGEAEEPSSALGSEGLWRDKGRLSTTAGRSDGLDGRQEVQQRDAHGVGREILSHCLFDGEQPRLVGHVLVLGAEC